MIATVKWSEYAPGLTQFRGYQQVWLRGDVVAGATVAAYLIPQVMAYATVAGLPPVVIVSGVVHCGYPWTRLDFSETALAGNECP